MHAMNKYKYITLGFEVHHRNVKTRIPQGSFPFKGIEELEMPEIEEAEEIDNALKVATTMAASSTSSGEETLKEEEDTIVKSPKVEKRLPQVPHFRGQQHRETNAIPVPVVNKVVEEGKKSKKEKKEEGKKRRRREKKPEPESESEYSTDKSSSDALSSSPPRRRRRGHQRRDQGRSPRKFFLQIRQSN